MTPRIQACDYCDSRWRRTPSGPADFVPSASAAWAVQAGHARACPVDRISLGVLTHAGGLHAALAMCQALAPAFCGAVVLLDAQAAPDVALPERTRLCARPLDGHFGDQRTALQRLSPSPWMLQLDTDESLGAATLAALPRVVRAADRDGVRSIGLARRNWVDGALSDHFPDPQYRLCRRTVRYEGQVHERPAMLSRSRETRLVPQLMIEHALTAARVRARTGRYDAMSDGATDTARPDDERALLAPFRP